MLPPPSVREAAFVRTVAVARTAHARTSTSRAEGRVHVLVTWQKQDVLDLVRLVLKPATRARRKEAQSAPTRSPASALRQRPPALGRRACGLRSHSSSEPKCFQDWTQLVLAAVPINEALNGSGPVINPARGIIRERRSLKPTARKLIGGRRASLHNLSGLALGKTNHP